jgi:antitoxin component of MazEF toxin-antitoxin module
LKSAKPYQKVWFLFEADHTSELTLYHKLDNSNQDTYNVRMNAINTTLTTSGNSVAVRLPQQLLKMSGLTDRVRLEAKQGKIIISKAANPREGWRQQIEEEVSAHGMPSMADIYGDLHAEAEATIADGLD